MPHQAPTLNGHKPGRKAPTAHLDARNGIEPQPTELAELIRRYRKAAGMSQVRLAALAGISKSYVPMLEAGRRGAAPSRDLILRLAQAFEVPPYDLLAAADRLEPGDRRAGVPLPSFAEVVARDLRLDQDAKRLLNDMYRVLTSRKP